MTIQEGSMTSDTVLDDRLDDPDENVASNTDSVPPAEEETPDQRRRWVRAVQWSGLGAAVALAVLIWAVVGANGANSGTLAAEAADRDHILIEGSHAIETLASLNPTELDKTVENWRSVTTGDLRESVATFNDDDRELVEGADAVVSAVVLEMAATAFDPVLRTATLMALVEVLTDPIDRGEPAVQKHRFVAEVVETDGRWLIASFAPAEAVAR